MLTMNEVHCSTNVHKGRSKQIIPRWDYKMVNAMSLGTNKHLVESLVHIKEKQALFPSLERRHDTPDNLILCAVQ